MLWCWQSVFVVVWHIEKRYCAGRLAESVYLHLFLSLYCWTASQTCLLTEVLFGQRLHKPKRYLCAQPTLQTPRPVVCMWILLASGWQTLQLC